MSILPIDALHNSLETLQQQHWKNHRACGFRSGRVHFLEIVGRGRRGKKKEPRLLIAAAHGGRYDPSPGTSTRLPRYLFSCVEKEQNKQNKNNATLIRQ